MKTRHGSVTAFTIVLATAGLVATASPARAGTVTASAVAPTDVTIKDGSYPLSRPLFFYTRAKGTPEIKKFTDWVLSPEGQAIVVKVGYFPLK